MSARSLAVLIALGLGTATLGSAPARADEYHEDHDWLPVL
jgi:hypothetical protein